MNEEFFRFLYLERKYTPQDLSDIAGIPVFRLPNSGSMDMSKLTANDLCRIENMRSLLNKNSQVVV